jgi:hypothetical protein
MDLLKKELNDLDEGSPTHWYAVSIILEAALTDANFHDDAKKVASIFKKADYEFDSKSEKAFVQKCTKLGRTISKMCEWDGYAIADSIGFYTSMTIGRPIGDKVEKLVESVSKKKINEWSAPEVIKQLGGNKFIAMTGAKNFTKDDESKFIMFKVPRAKNGITNVMITLTGNDLYNIDFFKIKGNNVKQLPTVKGVYSNELRDVFTQYTGLKTSLS